MTQDQEQREHTREPLMLCVKYGTSADYLSGWTENISAGGLFIRTEQTYRIGDVIRVDVSFPYLLGNVSLEGKVAWVREGQSPGIGVEVLSETARRKMARLAMLVGRERQSEGSVESDRVNLLVVEDNEHARSALRRVCKHLGRISKEQIDVRLAANGHEALAMIDEVLPDFIITDLYMPVMDGYTFLSRLRVNPKTIDTPVLVVSAADSTDLDRVKEFNVSAILEKPVRFSQLLETVVYLVHLRALNEED